MNMYSGTAFYCVLWLCYTSVHGIGNSDSKTWDEGQQTIKNDTAPFLTSAERNRRLVPYVTYYMVGSSDDNELAQYHQQFKSPVDISSTPRPRLQATTIKPKTDNQKINKKQSNNRQQQNFLRLDHQYRGFQLFNNNFFRQPIQTTTASYLRFPSSPKTYRPIVIATSQNPPYEVETERLNSYVYTPDEQLQYNSVYTSPRSVVTDTQANFKFGGFLPTLPPTEHPQFFYYSTTTVKPKKLKVKTKRPTTSTIKLPSTLPTRPSTIPQTPSLSSRLPITTTDKYGALNELIHEYDLGGRLSNKITAENIDSSIQTLSAVLQILQKESNEQSKSNLITRPKITTTPRPQQHKWNDYDDTADTSNPGRPGIDYPVFSTIPKTSFDCKTQRYKGFFGDPETHCQVWHYCDLNGGQASFLCPNGTIFNQVSLTCDWWFNVKCDTTAQLYVLNERLYKYIIPSKPSFPEDFEGPLVDRYLEEKFKETENQKSHQKEKPSPELMMKMLTTNSTTLEPDTVRTPYQQLLDVDT
ncbi:uncharacterized protein LOC126900881 isoform X2 [Daktulosphaira vitifoliae]|uniref:uncharacterized protein LOC126900881 isoform X2 n=1 Tax=Daktulosphaira vitifoliae TaxID=58002 RepID=UPI0021A9E084|nr:uncharacterized protein LOC126900881 isoform X2 [Daktulosphaira vitifoliae]